MSHYSLLTLRDQAAWLAHRDPRLRILAAVLFALVTLSLKEMPSLLTALGVAVLLALGAGFTMAALARRLLAFEGFMLVLLILLPFSVAGESVFALGPLTASWAGLQRAVEIVLKANAVVVMLITLVGTIEPVALGHALARLRVPDKLVHLFLFTVRYLGVLHDEYQRLRLAMRARAFSPASNRHTWRTVGWLVGMLLVRSLERSRSVQAAMRCRGFDGRLHLIHTGTWQSADSRAGAVALLALSVLLAVEHLQ